MKISNLPQAADYAKKLENALTRKREVMEWTNHDRVHQIEINRFIVIINGWEGFDPFEEYRNLTISMIDQELKMIRNTLECLGVEE